MRSTHPEVHRSSRSGWLRAAVLGANDGLLSVSGLVVGVAAGGATHSNIMLSGIAGLVAGAMSMAAGEYVSVHSQADTESADLKKERRELIEQPELELAELAAIYVKRGLDGPLALLVAKKLMAGDALGAHSRDELGITESLRAHPFQAALASAIAFAIGGIVPILSTLAAPASQAARVTVATTLVFLAVLGAMAAYAGGAQVLRGLLRVTLWGAIAMGITAAVGRLFGTAL
jgi:vacuolar iron transporter family protein